MGSTVGQKRLKQTPVNNGSWESVDPPSQGVQLVWLGVERFGALGAGFYSKPVTVGSAECYLRLSAQFLPLSGEHYDALWLVATSACRFAV